MSSVAFNGSTLVSSSEGGFRYTPGIVGTDIKVGKPARGKRRWAKDLGVLGAQHSLELVYDVSTGSYNTILNRLRGISDGKIGTLTMPDFPSVGRLVVTGVSISTPRRSKTGYYFTASITFEEL